MARSHGYSSGIHCRIISEKNRKEFLHAISVHLVPCHVSPHLKTVPSLSVHFSQLRYCFLVWLDSSSSIHSRPRDHFRVILRNSIHPPFCSGVGVIQRPNHSVAMISAPGEPNMVPLWHVSRCDLMSIPHSRIFGLSKNGGDKENTFPGGERIFMDFLGYDSRDLHHQKSNDFTEIHRISTSHALFLSQVDLHPAPRSLHLLQRATRVGNWRRGKCLSLLGNRSQTALVWPKLCKDLSEEVAFPQNVHCTFHGTMINQQILFLILSLDPTGGVSGACKTKPEDWGPWTSWTSLKKAAE